jgi:hypothetical protein
MRMSEEDFDKVIDVKVGFQHDQSDSKNVLKKTIRIYY